MPATLNTKLSVQILCVFLFTIYPTDMGIIGHFRYSPPPPLILILLIHAVAARLRGNPNPTPPIQPC